MYPTMVVDNFFEDVDKIISLSKKLKYTSATETDNWPGIRTESLHLNHYGLFRHIILKILSYYHPTAQVKYDNSLICFSRLKYGDKGKSRFHYDGDTVLAAIIYLSEGNITTGTTLFNKDKKEQIIVGNEFNSMVSYDGSKYHGFTSLEPLKEKERLTLNVFIKDVEVNYEKIPS